MPHEAYHQALMLVEIVDKLQKENCQQKLTIKRMEDELGGIALDNTGFGSHEPQPISMSPKSDFITSLFDDQGPTDPEILKTLGRWILDTGVSIPERTKPRSHQEVQAQLLKEAKQRGDALRRDNKILREQLAAEHLRSQACEKQIMIDTRERNEANRTIADQKYTIDRYIARQQFVVHKLLLAEQLTRLQDYIKNEEY